MLKDNEAKQILRNRTVMRHFIHRHVPAEWAPRVRDEHIAFLSSEHFLASGNDGALPKRRFSDLICRIRHPDDPEAPGALLLLLLEAQSTRDPRMPIRMLEYVALCLRRHWSLREPLPLVLPTVFYTGAEPWGIATAVEELRAGAPIELARFQPRMSYLLVAIGADTPCRADEGRPFSALLAVLQAESAGEVTRRLAELMLEAERDGAGPALDAIANALADVLVRRHEVQSDPERITTMEALMAETREWNYTPGVPELRKIIKEQQEAFKAELARERAERERERERAERERAERERAERERAERERAERERAERERAERERAEREREHRLLVRLVQKIAPDIDEARALAMSIPELHALIDEHT